MWNNYAGALEKEDHAGLSEAIERHLANIALAKIDDLMVALERDGYSRIASCDPPRVAT